MPALGAAAGPRAADQAVVDAENARFYGHFPFPWDCLRFDYSADPRIETILLNQAIGDWTHRRVPESPDIWVAGCGTNQAIFVALRFPHARVIASDLSRESLDICAETARQLKLSNLTLENESINRLGYRERFDYVLCTGVIHHNADPAAALQRLTAALKPSGVLELMVYNRYHRTANEALQGAVRLLRQPAPLNLDAELDLARRVLALPRKSRGLARLQNVLEDMPPARVADAVIQPVEHTYTVESLEALAADCGLVMLAPVPSPFDHGSRDLSWRLDFPDADLRARYEALTDVQRWQLVNLLAGEQSPMLWFYFQRTDCPFAHVPERAIDEAFLQQRFRRVETTREAFVRTRDGGYVPARSIAFPGPPQDAAARQIWDAADGARTVEDVVRRHALASDAGAINRVRLALTTPRFPHLVSA